jgi:site-specific recombinase XerD
MISPVGSRGAPGPLHYDREALLEAYRAHCLERCTSQDTIRENLRRAGKFVTRLGNLASLTEASVRAWRQARLGEVSRKTVNLEMDTLRQLLDLCQRFGWRDDNPARTLGKLRWKPSRLPRALTVTQIETPLQEAQILGAGRSALEPRLAVLSHGGGGDLFRAPSRGNPAPPLE